MFFFFFFFFNTFWAGLCSLSSCQEIEYELGAYGTLFAYESQSRSGLCIES